MLYHSPFIILIIMTKTLPPLRVVLEKYGLQAERRLGQNFLLDLNLTRRIARAAGGLRGVHVIEIGPGPGGLTRALLEEGAQHCCVIERDARFLPALEEIAQSCPGRVSIHHADALTCDLSALLRDSEDTLPVKIVANLPYNIGTALLTSWLETPSWPPFWASLTLLFQKEVALRIVAQARTRHYGRLSVLSNWRCDTRRLFDIAPTAFLPQPKVTSTLVQIVPRLTSPDVQSQTLSLITKAAFGQRRKMLHSSLKSLGIDHHHLLSDAAIPETCRAEELSPNMYVRLAQFYEKMDDTKYF